MIPNIINLQERMTALEERVENHIKVPSWWNRRTDARLDALEAGVKAAVQAERDRCILLSRNAAIAIHTQDTTMDEARMSAEAAANAIRDGFPDA